MRVRPHPNALEVTHDGQPVGPEGIEVSERDGLALIADGWSRVEAEPVTEELAVPPPPEPPHGGNA